MSAWGEGLPDVPAPGSDGALLLGCACPILDNAHGRGAAGTSGAGAAYWIVSACPLHGDAAWRDVLRDAQPCRLKGGAT